MLTNQDFRLATLLAFAIGIFLIPPLVHLHERALHIGVTLGALVVIGAIILCNVVILITRALDARWPILFTFTKFFITGVFNTTFDISIVNLLSFLFFAYAGWPLIAISTLSFFIILVFSYFINRSWSFGTKEVASLKEFSNFTLVSLGSFLINIIILYILTTITGAPNGTAEALWINIVKLLTAVISMTWNFIAFRFFVFKQQLVKSIPETTNYTS